ncbi:MAG TPA: dihydropteroate synthase, partial [Chromatiaceae bacterium]|nr:dihydropteroate synthase [Chromatiaceae bacterium]
GNGSGAAAVPSSTLQFLMPRLLSLSPSSSHCLMAGISRKSMIGLLTGRESDERLAGSLAAAVMAVERGAAIVRVHDVAPTVDALRVATAVMKTLVKD